MSGMPKEQQILMMAAEMEAAVWSRRGTAFVHLVK